MVERVLVKDGDPIVVKTDQAETVFRKLDSLKNFSWILPGGSKPSVTFPKPDALTNLPSGQAFMMEVIFVLDI